MCHIFFIHSSVDGHLGYVPKCSLQLYSLVFHSWPILELEVHFIQSSYFIVENCVQSSLTCWMGSKDSYTSPDPSRAPGATSFCSLSPHKHFPKHVPESTKPTRTWVKKVCQKSGECCMLSPHPGLTNPLGSDCFREVWQWRNPLNLV